MIKPFIRSQRLGGIAARTSLGKIISRLDRARVSYQLQVPGGKNHIAGHGSLNVEVRKDRLWCHVVGGVFRPSPFGFGFHSFWLTRRGMILLVAGLGGKSLSNASSIEPTSHASRHLKAEAILWLQSRMKIRPKRGGSSPLLQ